MFNEAVSAIEFLYRIERDGKILLNVNISRQEGREDSTCDTLGVDGKIILKWISKK
jgi:hypothetical protein